MNNNNLLLIFLAFILGCMFSDMMKKMRGYNLIEGGPGDDSEPCPRYQSKSEDWVLNWAKFLGNPDMAYSGEESHAFPNGGSLMMCPKGQWNRDGRVGETVPITCELVPDCPGPK